MAQPSESPRDIPTQAENGALKPPQERAEDLVRQLSQVIDADRFLPFDRKTTLSNQVQEIRRQLAAGDYFLPEETQERYKLIIKLWKEANVKKSDNSEFHFARLSRRALFTLAAQNDRSAHQNEYEALGRTLEVFNTMEERLLGILRNEPDPQEGERAHTRFLETLQKPLFTQLASLQKHPEAVAGVAQNISAFSDALRNMLQEWSGPADLQRGIRERREFFTTKLQQYQARLREGPQYVALNKELTQIDAAEQEAIPMLDVRAFPAAPDATKEEMLLDQNFLRDRQKELMVRLQEVARIYNPTGPLRKSSYGTPGEASYFLHLPVSTIYFAQNYKADLSRRIQTWRERSEGLEVLRLRAATDSRHQLVAEIAQQHAVVYRLPVEELTAQLQKYDDAERAYVELIDPRNFPGLSSKARKVLSNHRSNLQTNVQKNVAAIVQQLAGRKSEVAPDVFRVPIDQIKQYTAYLEKSVETLQTWKEGSRSEQGNTDKNPPVKEVRPQSGITSKQRSPSSRRRARP